MSFGAGVGDIIQAAKIVRGLYEGFSHAPEQYKQYEEIAAL
jgi:hypothetical protein